MKLSVALGTANLETCSLSIENYTADTVSVRYSGLSGNQPHSYQNYVAIWEATTIPWSVRPLRQAPIPQNNQTGTFVLGGVTITSSAYIVGYAVGRKRTDICAVARISAGGLRSSPSSVAIGIESVGTNSLAINYDTLAGYLPETYGNWIGLWKGYVSPYNAPKPIGRVSVDSDSSQGTVAMNDLELGIATVYSLVYFMGADAGMSSPRFLSNAAAILSFQTKGGEETC